MPSSVTSHTVPPFYACYFLRSISVPGSTYIGSTPSPPRRKRQHNGELTQGAWRTTRSRPWEMECIVYGFSSKIAALQFEWAWAKPHLSRHLREAARSAIPSADPNGANADASPLVPLFPATSLTPAFTKWGKKKRQRPKPPSSPNSRLLVLRALLRSEPFSGWGLRVAFFTEWSWGAFQRLEEERAQRAEADKHAGPSSSALRNQSRGRRLLHPTYPEVVCDFTGVDGKRRALSLMPAEERQLLGVKEIPASSTRTKNRLKKDDVPLISGWSEELPKVANVKGIGLTLQALDSAPLPPFPVPVDESRLIPKRRRKTEAQKEAEEAQDEAAGNEAEQSVRPRMRFNDDDLAELQWQRFERTLSSQGDTRITMDELLHAYTASLDPTAGLIEASLLSRTKTNCGLCKEAIDLLAPLSYVLCPAPNHELKPRAASAHQPAEARSESCPSIFHLSCLAHHFLASTTEPGATPRLLPTHGSCPSEHHRHHPDSASPVYWADVVRGMYRRRDGMNLLAAQHAKNALAIPVAAEEAEEEEEDDANRSSDEEDDDGEATEDEPEGGERSSSSKASAKKTGKAEAAAKSRAPRKKAAQPSVGAEASSSKKATAKTRTSAAAATTTEPAKRGRARKPVPDEDSLRPSEVDMAQSDPQRGRLRAALDGLAVGGGSISESDAIDIQDASHVAPPSGVRRSGRKRKSIDQQQVIDLT